MLLFGGQLLLVSVGVLALLVIQNDQHVAVASADAARHAQVVEADYFAGMTEAESGLTEYIDTGDTKNLINYSDGLNQAAAASADLRRVKTDAGGRLRLNQMFAEADAWQAYALRALAAPAGHAPPTTLGDALFESYTLAEVSSTAYLESVVSDALVAEARAVNNEVVALFGIAAVALITVAMGSMLIQRTTLRPMGRLIRAARELAAGTQTEIPPSGSKGEVGDLSRALHSWQRFSEKRTAVLHAMHEVSGRVHRDEIVRMGLERLLEVSDAAEVAVVLTGETGPCVITMTPDQQLHAPVPLPPGSALDIALVSGANLVGDFADERWPAGDRDWTRERGYGQFVVVPMISGSKPVGAIAATRSTGRPAFNVVDVSLVEAIAGPLAAAIRVASLFEEVQAVSAQLDIVNRHKTDFLSNMSHELRTPLNSILGFAELLVSPGFDSVTAKQARYIANIRTSGIHLASLIDDTLDLAKVESGKTELELERLDVGQLITEVVAVMQPLATDAKIQLLLGAGQPGAIRADRRKLHQVLLNLLSNAVKFTPPGGTVSIDHQRTDGLLLLTVVDTGIGIEAADRDRIFGAFEQVTGANRDGGGTGLGLALSRQYVALHGGRLWLESEIGKGSRFHVSLPVAGPSDSASERTDLPTEVVLLQK